MLVVVGAGCGSSAQTRAKTKSNVAKQETSPPGPCSSRAARRSTYSLVVCYSRANERFDRQIKAREKIISRLFVVDQTRADFMRSEQTWFVYRRQECRVEAAHYLGGSAEPVAYGWCVATRNGEHLAALAELERYFRMR